MSTSRAAPLLQRSGSARLVGVFNRGDSSPLVELCGHLGFDFAVLEDAHEESTTQMLRAARLAGMAPLVALDECQDWLVRRAIAAGAEGVILRNVPGPDAIERARAITTGRLLGYMVATRQELERLPEALPSLGVDLVLADWPLILESSAGRPEPALVRRCLSAASDASVRFGAVVPVAELARWLPLVMDVVLVDSSELFAGPALTFMKAARSSWLEAQRR